MKNKFITFLLIVCCLTLRIDVEAQGTWIMQDIPQAVSGVSLTKVGSDCIVYTKASSEYVYFFDVYAKAWTSCNLGSRQNMRAAEAGKKVVMVYSDSLLAAYSSITSSYGVIKYKGNIAQSGIPAQRGYGCGDKAAYVWTDANILYVFDGLKGEWKSYEYGITSNANGYQYFWCGDTYVAGIFYRNYPDKYRHVVYSLLTGTFNIDENGGVYVNASGETPMTGGFVSFWGGQPEAIQFTGYSAITNQFYTVFEDVPYGAFSITPIWNDTWKNCRDRNLFGYSITRGTGVSQPRNVKMNVFDTRRNGWKTNELSYPSDQFGEVAAAPLGGNIASFYQTGIQTGEHTFYVYSGETGLFKTLKTWIVNQGAGVYVNSGNNFTMALDAKKKAWFYNSNTGFSKSVSHADSNYINAVVAPDYASYCRYNPSSAYMDTWFYNALTDSTSAISCIKDVYPDYSFSPASYLFVLQPKINSMLFFSPGHDSLFSVDTFWPGIYSSYGSSGVFSWMQVETSALLFDAANLKLLNLNSGPVPGGVSDSLVLLRNGTVFQVYDATQGKINTFDLGEPAGMHRNGGRTLLISSGNYSKFYAFQTGQTGWVELQPEGNPLWYDVTDRTAVVVRGSKVYAYAPDIATDIHEPAATKENHAFFTEVYPNPFSNVLRMNWLLVKPANVVVKMFDVMGNEVQTLLDEHQAPGEHQFTFQADGLPGGIYFCKIKVNADTETRKLVLIK